MIVDQTTMLKMQVAYIVVWMGRKSVMIGIKIQDKYSTIMLPKNFLSVKISIINLLPEIKDYLTSLYQEMFACWDLNLIKMSL